MAGVGPFYWSYPIGLPTAFPTTTATEATLPEQTVAQDAAASQGMLSYSSLGQFDQLGSAGQNWLTAGTLSSMATAYNNVLAMGLTGPTYGLTPYNMAVNAQYAQLVNATASQLNQSNTTLSLISAGGAALLALSGRRLLGSTYTT